MVDIDFNLNQSHIVIQANLADKFQDVLNKYFQKTLLNPASVAFVVNGKQVDPSTSIQNHMSKLDKDQKKINVLVIMLESNEAQKEVITKSEVVICPECKEPCRIAFEDYKIKLYECPNKHERKNINIPIFSDTQKVNESKITCQQCNFKNKGNCPKNEFYRCLTCSKNICLLCKSNHDRSHNIIKYDQKNYICQKHNEPLIKYCTNCGSNICFACEGHGEHTKIDLTDLIPNMEEKKAFLYEMKTVINSIDLKIKETINILNEFSIFMKQFYDINNTIVENYNVKNRNYQVLQNLKEISTNNIIFNKLKDIKIEGNINDIINMYWNIKKEKQIKENINIKKEKQIKETININKEKQNKENTNMNKEKQKKTKENINKDIKKEIQKIKLNKDLPNEITIRYRIFYHNDGYVQIFGDNFIKNNLSKCKIIINGEKRELCPKIIINQNQRKENILDMDIKLQGIQIITDMSYMFYECSSLISLPDISLWNTINVTNMSYMFYRCVNLSPLSDISAWNTNNVTDMSYMFCYLSSLPDIHNWNTNNVTNMSGMFSFCYFLTSLPDISSWNTNNVTNMSWMFHSCQALASLPDISSWNTTKVTNMSCMFYKCEKLISLPDISLWNTNNVTDMSYMFGNCKLLYSLPDISSWNTNNATDMSYMFYECSSLISLPDISSWKIKFALKKECMFEGVDKKIIPKKFKGCIIY